MNFTIYNCQETDAFKDLCRDALENYNLLQLNKKILKYNNLLRLIKEETDNMEKLNNKVPLYNELQKVFSNNTLIKGFLQHSIESNLKIRKLYTRFLEYYIELATDTYNDKRRKENERIEARRNLYLKTQISCKCGSLISRRNYQVHLSSKKHKKMI